MREKYLITPQKRIEEIMNEIVFDGHFVYSAGGHGSKYFDKSWITFWPLLTAEICSEIASQWADENVEVVVGPAIGGIKLADRVAEALTLINKAKIASLSIEESIEESQVPEEGDGIIISSSYIVRIFDDSYVPEEIRKATIPALYTEKASDGSQVLKRGMELIEGKRTLIIEDIVNSGGSLLSSILACEKAGANIIGAHCLIDRSSGKVTPEFLGVEKFEALHLVEVDNFSAEECPLCKAGVPINTDRGHGQEYLNEIAAKQKQEE